MTSAASNEQMFSTRPFVFKAVVERIVGHHAPRFNGKSVVLFGMGSVGLDVKITKHVAVRPGWENRLEAFSVGSHVRLSAYYYGTSIEQSGASSSQGCVTVMGATADAFNTSLFEQKWLGTEFFFQLDPVEPHIMINRETGQRVEIWVPLMWTPDEAAWVEEQLSSVWQDVPLIRL